MTDIPNISDAYSNDEGVYLYPPSLAGTKVHPDPDGPRLEERANYRGWHGYPGDPPGFVDFSTRKYEGHPREVSVHVPALLDGTHVGTPNVSFFISEKDWEGMKSRFDLKRLDIHGRKMMGRDYKSVEYWERVLPKR